MAKNDKQTLTPRLRFPEFQGCHAWNEAKLEDIITTVTPPAKLQSSRYRAVGRFPIIDQSQEFICGWTDDATAVISDSLPLIVFGDHTCVLKFVQQPFAQGADGIKILRAETSVLAEFLFHSLNHHPLMMEDYKRHFSILKERRVFFPERKSGEQKKIADCLTSLEELIAAQGRRVEALKAQKKSLMQQLFPREGETTPRLRFPEFRKGPKWSPKKLSALLEETPRPIEMDDNEDYSLVTVKRRYGGVVSRERLKGRAIKVKSQFIVKTSDLLISKRQIVHNACGLVPPELDGSIVSNEYSVLRPRKECDIEFFNYFSQQPSVSASFLQSSVGIVIEKMLFKLEVWLKLEFLFPSKEEQHRIADCLSSLDARIAAEADRLTALKTHKKGLMQQLFPAPEGN